MSEENEFKVSDEVLYYNMLNLIGAIFRLAAQDMKYGRVGEVMEFVESEWFIDLCEDLNLDYKDVKKLIYSKKVLQRQEYH